MQPRKTLAAVGTAAAVGLAAGVSARAQDGYQQPPEPIRQILDAEPTPLVSISPDGTRLLLMERKALPGIDEVAAPELGLAGTRINPKTNGPSRSAISLKGLLIRPIEGEGEAVRVRLPEGAKIGTPSWSDDGKHLAFTATTDDGIALWVAETATGAARALIPPRLNAAGGRGFSWMPDGESLVVLLVPEGRGPAPENPVPSGPSIQESTGRAAPNRTYQDLLSGPLDEARFEHYFTGQIALVPVDGGATKPLGEPGIHSRIAPSPDGKLLLVETIRRPFSYLVPAGRFPVRAAVWDLEGKVVHTLVDRPLQEEVPIAFDAVIQGPRSFSWRDDAPATVVWSEALDGGDPAQPAAKRDRLRAFAAPFEGEPTNLLDVEYRIGGVTWARGDFALVTEDWWKTRRERTWVIQPDHPEAAPRALFDRSSEDRYGDPGRFVTEVGPLGTDVLRTTPDGSKAYLIGNGSSPEGDRPFLDEIDLATGATRRLFRSEAPYLERPVDCLGTGAVEKFITRRESVDEPANYFLRGVAGGEPRRLTDFADPAPQLAGLKSELIRYKRKDGVELSGKLFLPPGYSKDDGPIPFVLWAYPEEFKSASAASQVTGSPHQFTRPAGISHLFLLTQGYGILDGPSMPIVGQGSSEPNDTYIDQLVSSAEAAIDTLVERGLAERDKIAVGGHSYGAFMTANLLAHSNLFAAGIARSGAYNRTLTPFGFQAEERSFWDAGDTYMRMSPFAFANQIKTPILMIHGQADNNSGTFPIQSERMYAAIKGNGGTARLVFLPAESHGYQARESVGHTLYEMTAWLDRYLKGKSSPSPAAEPSAPAGR